MITLRAVQEFTRERTDLCIALKEFEMGVRRGDVFILERDGFEDDRLTLTLSAAAYADVMIRIRDDFNTQIEHVTQCARNSGLDLDN